MNLKGIRKMDRVSLVLAITALVLGFASIITGVTAIAMYGITGC